MFGGEKRDRFQRQCVPKHARYFGHIPKKGRGISELMCISGWVFLTGVVLLEAVIFSEIAEGSVFLKGVFFGLQIIYGAGYEYG
jgi:hypothetical protein